MKAAGITAEYNPFHNGHVYHIEQTRKLTGADAVIAAMSGDFVQRGEPALMDKWTRAEHALKSGVDLVLEIPALFALGNAGQFAGAAVRLLEATGKVTHISFGSESGDTGTLSAIAEFLKENSCGIDARIRDPRKQSLPYPAARALAYAEAKGEIKGREPASDLGINKETEILRKPNDILAVEYIKAMQTAKPLAVRREGGGYDSPFDEKHVFQSASALRSLALGGRDVSSFVPAHTSSSLAECRLTGPDTDGWYDFLRYAALSADEGLIEDCPSGGEGLSSLLKAHVRSENSWSGYIQRIKTKRYTYTRLSRLCMQLVLGITRTEYDMDRPEYIRVLGFSNTGRKLLAEIRDEECASLPVVINVNKSMPGLSDKAVKMLELDMHAADIYNLATGRDLYKHSDRVHTPVALHRPIQ